MKLGSKTHLFILTVVALTVVITVIQRMTDGRKAQAKIFFADALDADAGDSVCLPRGQQDFIGQAGVVIVTSSTCLACDQDAGFHRQLSKELESVKVPVTFVLNDAANQDQVARELRHDGHKVWRTDLFRFGITRTPSIAYVTPQGIVQSMWIGTVPSRSQQTFARDLLAGFAPRYARINQALFENARRDQGRNVVLFANISKRFSPGVKYHLIPLQDLAGRASYELPKQDDLFIDCANTPARLCQEGLLMLSSMGFEKLTAIDLPMRRPCI